jgi:hypothetical protein
VLLQEVVARLKDPNRFDYDEKGPLGESFPGGPKRLTGNELQSVLGEPSFNPEPTATASVDKRQDTGH